MKNENKSIITHQTCKDELLRLSKADIRFNLTFMCVLSVIFVPIIIATFYFLKHLFLVAIIVSSVLGTTIVYFAVCLIRSIKMRSLVKRDGFSIVTDIVSMLSEGEVQGQHTENAVYFAEHGRFVPTRAVFSLSEVNDTFYLVVTDRKKEPVLAYHSKIYDLE